ncbi:MAG: Si-specific NAD(P)(+) transhydrogenase [Sandaracinaceae bacterium]|nr:Si-specific NAD(P)(+) transhydrogenase [Sandaracinaceae bacterium]
MLGAVSEAPYDLVVIGSGPAGEKAAAQAAYFHKRVLVVEREPEPGGAAVHTGTLPSKTLRETAIYVSGNRSRQLYGVTVELDHSAKVPLLMQRKDQIAAMESARIRENYRRHDVDYVTGHARFIDPHTIEVEGRHIRGQYFLISTGSKPWQPSDIDFPDPQIHDSDEILHIERLPDSMTILGGGVIGCEYACMFAALGVKVSLVDARDQILPFLDHEIVARLEAAMRHLGIELHLGAKWSDVRRDGDQIRASLSTGAVVVAHDLLYAAGRVGCTGDLGLEHAGIEPNSRGYLVVDEAYRTAVPHILAAGDVIGFPALASTSMEQGRVAVCRAFGFDYKRSVTDLLPFGIYTIPEVSAVGKTEDGCRSEKIPHVVGRAPYRDNARGCITGDVEGITKLVVHAQTREVLGVHVIGERASELVHIGQAVMQLGGTVDTFIEMVFNFPTLAESYKYAAYECLGQLGPSGPR